MAYAVQVSAGDRFEESEQLWGSGRTARAEPFGVGYAGAPLDSARAYRWPVRIWADGDTAPGPWSPPASFETGLLDPALWQAQWVSGRARPTSRTFTTLYLRGTVDLPVAVTRARAYVSALGWYRLLVNGTDLTGHALVPRWTPFDDYDEYQTYDVTDAFRAGSNVLAVAVGDGRFRGRNGGVNHQAVYGDRLAGRMIDVRPTIGGGLTWARGTVQTPYGTGAARPQT